MSSSLKQKGDLAVRGADAPEIVGVDLCCGAGGLTQGLIRGGVRVVAGVDIDPECEYPYQENNHAEFIERSVTELTGADLAVLYGSASLRLLAGCAPCQYYSTYNRKGHTQRSQGDWELVSHFGRLIGESTPDLVTMENVPQLKDKPVFQEFLNALSDYEVWWDVVECALFGVPQTRKRLVLIASRIGRVELLAPEEGEWQAPTVRATIGDLPALEAGETDPHDRLHTSSSLSELNLRRIRASKPGGTWRDWDPSLLAACHLKVTGQTYPSVYGRMEWDAAAPTITTQCFGYGNGRFGHPEQDRAISLREAARLQTFPSSYKFVPDDRPVRFAQLGRLIGNAVPVRVGEVVGQSLVRHTIGCR